LKDWQRHGVVPYRQQSKGWLSKLIKVILIFCSPNRDRKAIDFLDRHARYSFISDRAFLCLLKNHGRNKVEKEKVAASNMTATT
jgi:hypothetical protein